MTSSPGDTGFIMAVRMATQLSFELVVDYILAPVPEKPIKLSPD